MWSRHGLPPLTRCTQSGPTLKMTSFEMPAGLQLGSMIYCLKVTSMLTQVTVTVAINCWTLHAPAYDLRAKVIL